MSLALIPLKIILLVLDFAIMMVTFGWVGILKKLLSGKKLRSVPVKDDESFRVDVRYKGALAASVDGAETLYDLTVPAFTKYGDLNAMGTREYLGQHTPKIKKFGGVSYRTFAEVGDEAMKFGAALRASGHVPAPETSSLDKFTTHCSLAIFENTSAEWLTAALGSFTQSIIVTTVYATLGIDAVVEAINDGIIASILCNKRSVAMIVERSASMPTLKNIIYTSNMIAPDEVVSVPTAPNGVKIISYEEFVKLGDTEKFPPTPPKPDTTAVVMYTSGSTGKPKGVILKHRHVAACSAAAQPIFQPSPGDHYIAYLPAAHIMEMMAEFLFFGMGVTLCFSDPKTLTAKGSYPQGALEVFKPHMMVAVPKVWDSVKKGIEAKVASSSKVSQFLVKTAFQARAFAFKLGYDTPLFKKLVFKKFSAALGGRMRFALSGGGPLNAEVQEFARLAFGFPLVQGYGLTETCAGLTIQAFDDPRTGVAGVPIPSVEVKLVSTPDVMDRKGKPYLTGDRLDHDGNAVLGRGEIWVRGNNIAEGYYMMPGKTKEEFDDDGFFHTGDIGQFLDDGSIRIVDRKKNLVKLKGGEYVALENMEMVYGNSKFVDAINGGVCCYGDGDMDRPIILMQLQEDVAMKFAIDHKIEGSFEDVKKSKVLYDAVLADLMSEANKGGLTKLENVVALAFMDKPWTPENGCLTAANKLQRKQVVTMFEKVFEETKKKGIF